MKIFSIIIVLCTILQIRPALASIQYTNCGTPASKIKVTLLDVTPNPMIGGKQACFTANGSILNSTVIDGGDMMMELRVGPIPWRKQYHLCDLSALTGHPCPIKIPSLSLKQCIDVPEFAAGLSISFNLNAKGGHGEEYFCLKGNLQCK